MLSAFLRLFRHGRRVDSGSKGYSETQEAGVTRNVISFHAAISACEEGGQWQQALSLLAEMQDAGAKYKM